MHSRARLEAIAADLDRMGLALERFGPAAMLVRSLPHALPKADPADLTGPAPPEATELTREQRRFFRYDRNRDLKITRNEMLSTRSDAFRKLDKDGNKVGDVGALARLERGTD